MAVGFPPYHKDRRSLVLSVEETKARVLKALEEMDYQEIGLHPFAIDYKSPGAVLTAGERFYVNVTDKEIVVRSECIFITQIFDFGKNKANIQEFWKVYDSIEL